MHEDTTTQCAIRHALTTILEEFKQDSELFYICRASAWNYMHPDLEHFLMQCIKLVKWYSFGFKYYVYSKGEAAFEDIQAPLLVNNKKFRIMLLQDLINDMNAGKEFISHSILFKLDEYKANIDMFEQRLNAM